MRSKERRWKERPMGEWKTSRVWCSRRQVWKAFWEGRSNQLCQILLTAQSRWLRTEHWLCLPKIWKLKKSRNLEEEDHTLYHHQNQQLFEFIFPCKSLLFYIAGVHCAYIIFYLAFHLFRRVFLYYYKFITKIIFNGKLYSLDVAYVI